VTVRERIEAAYRREPVDRVPWTVYGGMLKQINVADRLMEMDLGVISMARIHRPVRPNVEVVTETVDSPNGPGTRTIYRTPVGEVDELALPEPNYGSLWKHSHLIERAEDYAVVEFMIRDTHYEIDATPLEERTAELGNTGVVFVPVDRSPLQKMWVELMGAERFGIDMLTEPDRFWALHEVVAEDLRQQFRLVAEGPGEWIWFPENLTAPIVGATRFGEHMLPWYNEQCDLFHSRGKTVLAHCDGVLAPLLDGIAACGIDVIEAFTPTPDGDLSVAQARAAWPEKCLSLNFPSSVHLRPPEQVRAVAEQILTEAGDGIGLVVGITENIPLKTIDASLTAVGEVLQAQGRVPLGGN